MEAARLRLVEHHRVNWLDRQLADAARVRSARSFVRAARQGNALADEDLAWLDWVEVHITETDPLLQPLAPAEPPEATSQNLAPFLGSVSPYGPSWY
jgi:hypothetical protein